MTVDGTADQPTPAARPAPPPPPGAGAGDGGAKKKHHPEGNVKETIESILVAFILAFVFRAFVVEAFVIPTGSMAPTLLGAAHAVPRAPTAGTRSTVNYPTRSAGDDIDIPPARSPRRDRRRADPLPQLRLPGPAGGRRPGTRPRPTSPVHYGDRILVLKYLYLFGRARSGGTSSCSRAPTRSCRRRRRTRRTTSSGWSAGRARRHGARRRRLRQHRRPPAAAPTRRRGRRRERVTRHVPRSSASRGTPRTPSGGTCTTTTTSRTCRPRPAWTTEEQTPWRQPWEPEGGGRVGRRPEPARPGTRAGPAVRVRQRGRPRPRSRSTPTPTPRRPRSPTTSPTTRSATSRQPAGQLNVVERPEARAASTRRQSATGRSPVADQAGRRFTARVTPGQGRARYRDGVGRAPGGEVSGRSPCRNGGAAGPARIRQRRLPGVLRVNGREVLATGDEYDPAAAELVQSLRRDAGADGATRSRRRPPPWSRCRPSGSVRCRARELARDVFYINDWNAGSRRRRPSSPATPGRADQARAGRVLRARRQLADQRGRPQVADAGRAARRRSRRRRRPRARAVPARQGVLRLLAGRAPPARVDAAGFVPNFGDMRFIHVASGRPADGNTESTSVSASGLRCADLVRDFARRRTDDRGGSVSVRRGAMRLPPRGQAPGRNRC